MESASSSPHQNYQRDRPYSARPTYEPRGGGFNKRRDGEFFNGGGNSMTGTGRGRGYFGGDRGGPTKRFRN